MLDMMRRNANSWLMLLIFGAIIVVFAINFGPWAGNVGGDLPYAAMVDGRVISKGEFIEAVGRRRRLMQGQPNAASANDVKKQVIDQMISAELLAQLAEDNGIAVSDADVAAYIKKAMFNDGPFDREVYDREMAARNTTAAHFEDMVRRELMTTQMRKLVEAGVHVSDDELKERFDMQNNRARLDVLSVDPLHFSMPTKTDAEVAAWADQNADKIKAYYDDNERRYKQPKKVRARHVLFKAGEKASDADKAAAKAKAEDILKKAKAGEDFAKLARENSEDGSAAAGGDLGLFGPGAMVKPFETAAFALKAGELSGVVQTRFGFHVIKVEDVVAPKVQKLEDVKVEIAKKLIEKSIRGEQAKALATQGLEQLKGGTKVAELNLPGLVVLEPGVPAKPEQRYAPRVEDSGWFSKSASYVRGIGPAEDIVKAAFAGKTGEVLDKVFEVNGKYFVVRIAEREAPDAKKFDSEKGTLRSTMVRIRAARAVRTLTDGLRADANVELNPALFAAPAS